VREVVDCNKSSIGQRMSFVRRYLCVDTILTLATADSRVNLAFAYRYLQRCRMTQESDSQPRIMALLGAVLARVTVNRRFEYRVMVNVKRYKHECHPRTLNSRKAGAFSAHGYDRGSTSKALDLETKVQHKSRVWK
jgi:hypothetical protein